MKVNAIASRSKGFTLLEVMVAFVIVALGVGGAYRVMGGSAGASAAAEESLAEATAVEALIARVGDDLTLSPGTTIVSVGNRRFEVVIARVPLDAGLTDATGLALYDISIVPLGTIAAPRRGRPVRTQRLGLGS
ncbi:MAG: prepilin-type N-terminal cleavage/methylation domain-containing protein [Pseudomonadota bacterium]